MVATSITLVYGIIVTDDILLQLPSFRCQCAPHSHEGHDDEARDCLHEMMFEMRGGKVAGLGKIRFYEIPHDDAKVYHTKTFDDAAKKSCKGRFPPYYVLGVPIVEIDTDRGGKQVDIELDEEKMAKTKKRFLESVAGAGSPVIEVLGRILAGVKLVKDDCSCCS